MKTDSSHYFTQILALEEKAIASLCRPHMRTEKNPAFFLPHLCCSLIHQLLFERYAPFSPPPSFFKLYADIQISGF